MGKQKSGDEISVHFSDFFGSQIQLGAFTPNKSHTDWTKSFSLNAVGTSGNFSARLGENSYRVCVCVCSSISPPLSEFYTSVLVGRCYVYIVGRTPNS